MISHITPPGSLLRIILHRYPSHPIAAPSLASRASVWFSQSWRTPLSAISVSGQLGATSEWNGGTAPSRWAMRRSISREPCESIVPTRALQCEAASISTRNSRIGLRPSGRSPRYDRRRRWSTHERVPPGSATLGPLALKGERSYVCHVT